MMERTPPPPPGSMTSQKLLNSTIEEYLGYDGACPDIEKAKQLCEEAGKDAIDETGKSAVYYAAMLGRNDLLLWLMEERGDNVNYYSGYSCDDTPLHIAAEQKRTACVQTLLTAGAHVNAKNKNGCTPLEMAMTNCFASPEPIVQLLLDAGATQTSRFQEMMQNYHQQQQQQQASCNNGEKASRSNTACILQPGDEITTDVVADGSWQTQHGTLWKLLVPQGGHAPTLQGELIRLSGKVNREVLDNGSVNWSNDDLEQVLKFVCKHLVDILPSKRVEIEHICSKIVANITKLVPPKTELYRISELTVQAVLEQPTLRELTDDNYII